MLKLKPSFHFKTALIFPSVSAANEFVNLMRSVLKNEKVFLVSDLYYLFDIRPKEADWIRGWSDIKKLRVRKILFSKRCLIVLPRLNYCREEAVKSA